MKKIIFATSVALALLISTSSCKDEQAPCGKTDNPNAMTPAAIC
jgi:hypothetical protein